MYGSHAASTAARPCHGMHHAAEATHWCGSLPIVGTRVTWMILPYVGLPAVRDANGHNHTYLVTTSPKGMEGGYMRLHWHPFTRRCCILRQTDSEMLQQSNPSAISRSVCMRTVCQIRSCKEVLLRGDERVGERLAKTGPDVQECAVPAHVCEQFCKHDGTAKFSHVVRRAAAVKQGRLLGIRCPYLGVFASGWGLPAGVRMLRRSMPIGASGPVDSSIYSDARPSNHAIT
jgi:hypothetical protein